MNFASSFALLVIVAALDLTYGSCGFYTQAQSQCNSVENRLKKLEASTLHCVSGSITSGVANRLRFSHTYTAKFPKAFKNVPQATIGLTYIDLIKGSNTRIKTDHHVTKNEIKVTFASWADTKFYRARVSYMACGYL